MHDIHSKMKVIYFERGLVARGVLSWGFLSVVRDRGSLMKWEASCRHRHTKLQLFDKSRLKSWSERTDRQMPGNCAKHSISEMRTQPAAALGRKVGGRGRHLGRLALTSKGRSGEWDWMEAEPTCHLSGTDVIVDGRD